MKSITLAFAFMMATAGLLQSAPVSGGIRYLEYPITAPGQVTKVEKILDASGKVTFSLGPNGFMTPSDLVAREKAERNARRSLMGNLSDTLNMILPFMAPNGSARVVVYLKYPLTSYPDKTITSEDELKASSLAAAATEPIISLDILAQRYGINFSESYGHGKAMAEVGRDQLLALQSDTDVAAVELLANEHNLAPEFSTLGASAYNPGPVPGSAGSGVHAATIENGLTSTFLSCIGVSPAAWDANTNGVPADIFHTQAVFKCLVAAAPSASFYHLSDASYSDATTINYLINNGIQTVSMSRTRGDNSPYHSTYSEFLVMDDFAYRWPYPVFVNPSANAGYQYEVNWQCYNAVSVGNVRHTNNSTYEFADCTQTKNPPPIYGSCISGTGASCAGDREMPHIVAPGIPYTGSTFATTCVEGSGTANCGTSWSAPIANGIAADVISADSRLSGWPEKVRAALILTAQNVDGGDWVSTTDGRDGTGVISGSEAVNFAKTHTAVSPGNAADTSCMAASSMYASDFSGPNKRFYVKAPNPMPSGKHLRVVLTWDSNPIVGGSTNALSDVDLIVGINGGSQGSYSWDNNVEVVDVLNSNLTAGNTYYIDVDPVTNRIPSSGSRTNFFYYALAWKWVADHAP